VQDSGKTIVDAGRLAAPQERKMWSEGEWPRRTPNGHERREKKKNVAGGQQPEKREDFGKTTALGKVSEGAAKARGKGQEAGVRKRLGTGPGGPVTPLTVLPDFFTRLNVKGQSPRKRSQNLCILQGKGPAFWKRRKHGRRGGAKLFNLLRLRSRIRKSLPQLRNRSTTRTGCRGEEGDRERKTGKFGGGMGHRAILGRGKSLFRNF